MNKCISNQHRGFSLLELLVVMGIILLILGLAIPAFNVIGRGMSLTKAGDDVAGVLKQARAHAMANNTYTWVGFTTGENQDELVIGVVASRIGERRPADTDARTADSDIRQLGSLWRFQGIGLVEAPVADGDDRESNESVVQLADQNSAILDFTLRRPWAGSGGDALQFNQRVIQFNSRGEARVTEGTANRVMEVGLQQVVNGVVPEGLSNNYVAIQIGGITGNVQVYRP